MKFLIIDDHPLLLQGVATSLKLLGPGVAVLQAQDGDEGLRLISNNADVSCALVDLNLRSESGLQILQTIRERCPTLPVLVLSGSENPTDVRSAFSAGANGYCPKSAGQATLLAAIRLILEGETYVPAFMAFVTSQPDVVTDINITTRQLDVLRLVCVGKVNKDIARALGMQEKTVKAHVTAIFKALSVVNRSQVVAAARKAGIVD